MKHLLVFLMVILEFLSASGQDSTITTITLSGQQIEFDQAERYQIVWKEDSLWRADLYYLTEVLASQASYTDSELKNPIGEFQTFFSNGRIQNSGTIKDGNLVGDYKEWFDNGALSAEGSFDVAIKDEDPIVEIANVSLESFNQDSILEGKRIGTWKFYHYNGELSALLDYDHGELISAAYFESDGNVSPSDKITDRPAYYEYGLEALYKRITSNFSPPNSKRKLNFGLVKVKFTVERDGKVTNVELHTSQNKGLDRMCLREVSKILDFVPAIENNRTVSQDFILPFRFRRE